VTTSTRVLGALAALVATATLTSCVQVPDAGPVVVERPRGHTIVDQTIYTNPPPPAPGATRQDIVTGFLDAMTATPFRPAPATAFLTTQAQTRWHPARQVLVYGRQGVPTISHGVVQLGLRHADRVGPDGQWLGAVSPAEATLSFTMEKESGEWRIAHAPNAFVLPQSYYLAQFNQDASLYFFDPTGRILVPEPVHVPQGSQLVPSLVQYLVHGPRPGLRDVERSFLPPGLDPTQSVRISGDTAQISLGGTDPGPLSQRVVRLMLAQLTYTLRQDTTITAFTLTIAGRPVTFAGGSRFRTDSDAFDHFDPAGSASSQAYALRKGRLVSGRLNQLTAVNGPFGATDTGIGSFAVNLDDSMVAGVAPGGLLLGRVRDDNLGQKGSGRYATVLTGTGLLRPSWDFANRLWTVQDGPGGAVIRYVAATSGQGTPRRLRVPGISGTDVKRFLVSRDGSRMIAVIGGADSDRIVVSRLRYDATGRALGGTRATSIPWSSHTQRIRDIGWTTPTTIAVLDQLNPVQAERRILRVDGSTPPSQAQPSRIPGVVRGLMTSPAGSTQPPYAVLRTGGLYDISQVESTRPTPIERRLRHLTYAG
jgi:hypothetical protein